MGDREASGKWRDVDIFVVLVLYATFLVAFLYTQSFFFGSSSLDDSNKQPLLFVFEEVVDAALLALVPIYFVRKVYGGRISDVGLTARRPMADALFGFAIGVLLFGVAGVSAMAIESAFGVVGAHPYLEILDKTTSATMRLVVYASILVLAPLSEEIFFRGFVYRVLKTNHGIQVAIVGSATLFTAIHFSLASFVPIFIAGIALAWLFERTGSLISPMVAHATFNILNVAS